MLGLGADREILRRRVRRRLLLAGAHAARPGHCRCLRPTQKRDRKIVRPRTHGAARHGDDGLALAFIGRLIVIAFAVMVASLAAGIAIAMGMLGPEWHSFSGDFGERTGFWLLVAFGASFTGAIGLLPLVIMIALAETFKIRSLLVNAAAGAAMMVLGLYASGLSNNYEESIDHPPPPVSRETELAAAAGIVLGLTYWAIAGRKAGRWREPRA